MRSDITNLDRRLEDHDMIACHGQVCEDIRELKVRQEGQERSLRATNEANRRLSERVYRFQLDIQRSPVNNDGGMR